MKLPSTKEELLARLTCSRIQEALSFMELIGASRKGVVTIEDGKAEKSLSLSPWNASERKFLNRTRNQFAHNQLTIRPDGSVHTIDHRTSKEKVYSLEELSRLFNRVHSLIHDRLVSVLEIQVECSTCGQQVYGDNVLSCGHVEYGEQDFETSTLVRKPKGATAKYTVIVGLKDDISMENNRIRMVMTNAGIRLMLNNLKANDKS